MRARCRAAEKPFSEKPEFSCIVPACDSMIRRPSSDDREQLFESPQDSIRRKSCWSYRSLIRIRLCTGVHH